MNRHVLRACLAGLLICGGVRAEAPTVFVQGNALRLVDAEGQKVLDLVPAVWGPQWAWTGMSAAPAPAAPAGVATFAAVGKLGGTDAPFSLTVKLTPEGNRKLRLEAVFTLAKGSDLTLAVLAIRPGESLRGADRATVVAAAGKQTLDVPFARGSLGKSVERLEIRDGAGQTYAFAFAQATEVVTDGEARLVLAAGRLEANAPGRVGLTLELPADTRFQLTEDSVPLPPNWAQWFPWQASGDADAPSSIGLAAWLEAPAGKHGRVTRQDNQLIYNGKPAKFWGLNVSYGNCAPAREAAEQRAKFYAKYGINSVRFHKFAEGAGWAGAMNGRAFAAYDPKRLDDLDYFVNQLKQRGIYLELSANFGRVMVGPDDLAQVPFASELKAGHKGWREATQGMMWFATELQDLQAAQVVNLLNHHNPHSGLRYADDPAVLAIELVNENSLFFYTTLGALQNSPTIRKRAGEAFFAWLKQRYGNEQALLAAWGSQSLKCFTHERLADEGWDLGRIYPVGNPWFFDPEQLAGQMRERKTRLLDTMHFLYDQQSACYDRLVKAIRATGYQGEILGSNWQAGRALSHFANLHTDYRVGLIDRHNYFGGAGSMLATPGGGMLSAGMQQVADRPFMLSEWIHSFPSEFAVEGPALIGAYGLGLNGWDASYIFENGDDGRFRRELKEEWDVMVPQVLGVFPAVSRQVLRGDVKEASLVFTRNVHVPSLFEGRLGFDDSLKQGYDVKEFSSQTIPAATLAIGRSVVAFTPAEQPTPTVSLASYLNDGLLRSADGQLAWRAGKNPRDGYVTIDTAGTQALIGFAAGKSIALKDVAIATSTPYAAIYVSALDRDGDIATGKRLLVTTLARVRNTGMKLVEGSLIARGGPPLLVEPVAVELTLKRGGNPKVYVLDHDGRRSAQTLPAANGKLTLDGAQTKAVYYEIDYSGN